MINTKFNPVSKILLISTTFLVLLFCMKLDTSYSSVTKFNEVEYVGTLEVKSSEYQHVTGKGLTMLYYFKLKDSSYPVEINKESYDKFKVGDHIQIYDKYIMVTYKKPLHKAIQIFRIIYSVAFFIFLALLFIAYMDWD